MKIIRFWGPALCWMAVIFILSSTQRIAVSDKGFVNFFVFKSLHVAEYAVLFLLYFRALVFSAGRIRRSDCFAWAFVLTVLYAATDEFHQTLVPTREGKVRDVIIDAIGAGLAWYFLIRLLPKMPKKLQRTAKHWGLLSGKA